jgi:predicted adenine nucleotide alpha hydrolase (AANH) superfamily ATPase
LTVRGFIKQLRAPINNMEKPSFLLHICCAPCSLHVLALLEPEFDVKGIFFNPNIHPPAEYAVRLAETTRVCGERNIELIAPPYQPRDWFNYIKGRENEPEGGERCSLCIRMRLEETARAAASRGCDYFGTTLSISPHKNANPINRIGKELAPRYRTRFHEADFKKRDGYKLSCELSKKYGLYRQNYCGCIFSYRARYKSKFHK